MTAPGEKAQPDYTLRTLKEFLQTAVPLYTIRFKDLPWEDLKQIMRESETVLQELGEIATFSQFKKDATAKAFNAIAKAIAALSFVPQGIDIFGLHFETKYEGPSIGKALKAKQWMGSVEGWVVTQDGETVRAGFANDGEAMAWLHDRYPGSVDHAVRHAGYDIVLVRGGKVEWSLKNDLMGRGKGGHAMGAAADPGQEPAAEEFEDAVRRAFMGVYGPPSDPAAIQRDIRSSYLPEGRKLGWTEPHPYHVLVITESGWVQDPYGPGTEHREWDRAMKVLHSLGWPKAWWDSINPAVHVVMTGAVRGPAERALPATTNGPKFWDKMADIYRSMGGERFLKWAERAVAPRDAWAHAVNMMAWNDRNSEFNLDPNIAESRETREGDEVTEADVSLAMESMVEGLTTGEEN